MLRILRGAATLLLKPTGVCKVFAIYHIKGQEIVKYSNSLRGAKIIISRYNKNAGYIAYAIKEIA